MKETMKYLHESGFMENIHHMFEMNVKELNEDEDILHHVIAVHLMMNVVVDSKFKKVFEKEAIETSMDELVDEVISELSADEDSDDEDETEEETDIHDEIMDFLKSKGIDVENAEIKVVHVRKGNK